MSRFLDPRAAVLSLALLAACGRIDSTPKAPAPLQVRTASARVSATRRTVEAVGTLRGLQEATIAGKIMGTVIEIRKRAGDPVRRGETLVVVDGRDVSGQVAQAQGSLAQARAAFVLAETNFRRFEQLHSRGSASALELDQARYQMEAARGAVSQAEGAVAAARSYEDYAEIAAPFDGRVVDRFCETGDLAAPGRPLLKIESAARTRLDVFIEADQMAAAVPGAAVSVQIPSLPGRSFTGTVAEVVPAADASTRSFLVKIEMQEDPSLRAGLFGRARFSAGTRAALQVPRGAVLERGGLTGIFVAEDGRASFRLVSAAPAGGDSVEILSGLREGDRLILSPPATLETGTAVTEEG